MKAFKLGAGFIAVSTLLGTVLSLAFLVVLCYVAFHFIAKAW